MRRGEFQWKSLELIIFQFSENCIGVKLSQYARFPGNKSSFSQHFELVFFYPITRKPIHQERNYDAAFSAEISTHLCRRACSIHGQGLGVILLRLLCLLLVNLKDEKKSQILQFIKTSFKRNEFYEIILRKNSTTCFAVFNI